MTIEQPLGQGRAGAGRRFGRFWTAVALLLAVPGWCRGQVDLSDGDLNPLKPAAKPSKPTFTTMLTPESAGPGDIVTLAITVKLPKGNYIYSTTGTFGGRTVITAKTTGLEPVDGEFLPDREPKVEFEPLLNQEVGKFFGQVTWSRKFRVQDGAQTASISGELTGQYCGGPDAENASCVPIRPPYRFDVPIYISGVAAPSERVSVVYAQHAQPTIKKKGKDEPGPIAFDFELSPSDARPGEKVTLSIKATLEEGWHTFSLTQRGEGGLPTVIDVSKLAGLKPLGDFVADPPFEIEEQGGLMLEVHYHQVTWRREFEVTAENYGLSGQIAYQTCKNVCLPLKKTAFSLGRVDGPAVVADADPPAPERPAPAAGAPLSSPKAPRALLPFVLLCLGGGFLALLTPCSFPMVPITVSFFLKQSEAEHKRPWLLALVYCGSIVAAFTILGVGISAVFGATKLNELANIAWLNVVIGTVFVLFALNMLGVFEIHMPGWLLTMTASKESASSYLGAVFMALTFTLTSFTCTFAIAGSLLVGAARGDVYWPVIGMLAFGTAFAAPFFVLAMIPGLLKKLPKSGGWMNSVKVVMGLLEVGAAVKFFSIADPAQVVFDHVTVMMIWFVLAVVTALYLFGWFRLPHDTVTQQISPLRMLLGTGFFVLAGLLLIGVMMPDRGGAAVRQILAFAPAKFEAGQGRLGPSLKHHGLEFALYFDKALPVAQKENRPLLLDFTGVNCANCRDMELKMGRPEWKERIAKFVGVQLYVDVPQIPTIHDPAEGERLRAANEALELQLVQDSSMPAYAILAPDGTTVLATYIGAEPANKTGTFVKFLDEGWSKWEQLQANGRVGQGAVRLAREQ
jgi:thiol:disulfide interchange protein DsbD